MSQQPSRITARRVFTHDIARIAAFLSHYSQCRVRPEDIEVLAGPDADGALRVGWRFDHFAQHFVLTPGGEVRAIGLQRIR